MKKKKKKKWNENVSLILVIYKRGGVKLYKESVLFGSLLPFLGYKKNCICKMFL